MKRVLFLVTIIGLLLFVGCNTYNEKSVDEVGKVTGGGLVDLIQNGSADNGTEKWGVYVNNPGVASFSNIDNEIHYDINNVGTDKWHIQGTYAGLPFIEGETYNIAVDMSSTIPRPMQLRIQLDRSPYSGYIEEDIMLTEEMQTYNFEFVMSYKTDEYAKLCFNIGLFDDGVTEPHVVKIDNLSIKTMSETGGDTIKSSNISINQVGYLPVSKKVVRSNSGVDTFLVKEIDSDSVVFEGQFTKEIDDPASGEIVYIGDFSSLDLKGTYYVEIPEDGKSTSFVIEDNIYKPLQNAVQKMFYYQRCGEELLTDFASIWAHGACHLEHATVYGTDTKLDVSGGWHDAGDYGRYVGPGAKAVADLMLANTFYPDQTSFNNLDIPKNDKFDSNIVSEIKYELDWILKMQDRVTGGVYHKVSTANFIGSVMPDQNSDELILSPISATATGDFAAIMAMSSRFYMEIDPEYSAIALEAAKKAWVWLESNTDAPGFKNPEGISTGEYGDENSGDERFWASIELFLSTGDETYHNYAIQSFKNNSWDGLGWGSVGTYGVISYIFSDFDKKDLEFNKLLEAAFLKSVDKISEASLVDGYGISLGVEYFWGSNQIVADNGVRLLLGNKITGNELYISQAKEHMDYLLGVNALAQSYVSGFGEKSMKDPHHRPTTAAGQVVPGMVAGGPNMQLQDPLAQNILSGSAPSKCYVDAEPSYSTNEITIYWNSPLYFLISAFVE